MALVDYTSTSASSSDNESVTSVTADSKTTGAPPPAKRRRRDSGEPADGVDGKDGLKAKQPASDLPPLPDSFHDLYASSVRVSASDNPSLHQGRKRSIPHVVGNWPSHIYIEWHPTTQQHVILVKLFQAIEAQLGDLYKLHSFLTSDLNAPLPLHISLSKPLALKTSNKDAFLETLTTSLRSFFPPPVTTSAGAGARKATKPTPTPPGAAFAVSPGGLAFYKSPDSDRTFLVLRVANAISASPIPGSSYNPQLRELLRRSNAIAASHGLPILYAQDHQLESDGSRRTTSGTSGDEEDAETALLIDNAFHVSIGWTFRLPDEDTCLKTYRIFRSESFREMRKWSIGVTSVKAKIGNVVTSIPLSESRSSISRTSAGVSSSNSIGRGGSGSPATSGYRSGSSSRYTDGEDSPWT